MPGIKFNPSKKKPVPLSSTQWIVISFFILIATGTALLLLPIASKPGVAVSFTEALFTATSASCVTGLVIVDTYDTWTLFGQVVILTLIQVGALGIVTLATSFAMVLGKKISLQGKRLAVESTNYHSFQGILNLVKKILIITLTVEIIGAIILSIRFVPIYGAYGIYMGIFHAISAFCNSGFDLLGHYQGLTSFYNDAWVLVTISVLILLGGLGFLVWENILEYRKTKTFLLHTKIVFSLSALLIIWGTILFLFFEYQNPHTMGNLSNGQKILNAFFQSMTTRTAGFQSVEFSQMNEISKIISIFLMFIGTASGSTGGGIRLTTFAVITIAILSEIRGSTKTVIFNEKIQRSLVFKSLAILGLSFLLVIIMTAFILTIEQQYTFTDILFEVTSAFGTVGLTTLGTQNLSTLSHYLLILTMFIGRVGVLTFAISISMRKRLQSDKIYPEGRVMVG